jgi:hypothetical protein
MQDPPAPGGLPKSNEALREFIETEKQRFVPKG